MKRKLDFCFIVLGLVIGVASTTNAKTYSFTSFDYPNANITRPEDINNSGHIVGTYEDATGTQGFLYVGGSFSRIDYPGAKETAPYAINDSGDIVGNYIECCKYYRYYNEGFLYSEGSFTRINYSGAIGTRPCAINNWGGIVGTFYDILGFTHGFSYLWGTYNTLGENPRAINDSNKIVGYNRDATGTHGFLYEGGFTRLDFPGAKDTAPYAINNSGSILGDYRDPTGTFHGFPYTGGTFTSIDFPGATGEIGTIPCGVNDHGIIVGFYNDTNGSHGFLSMPREERDEFDDVPVTYWAYDFVMALYNAGITGDCLVNPPLFCPEVPITRGQMAVSLETSLGHSPNNCTGRFTDVSVGNPFCGFIERLADDGITSGCYGGKYCPDAPLTRAQMAVFIEAAMGRSPKNPCTGRFTDVNAGTVGEAFCRFIEDFAEQGITGGCSTDPPMFCPDSPVTRAQMAVFLVAAPDPLKP